MVAARAATGPDADTEPSDQRDATSEERPMCLAVPGRVLDIEERDGTRMATVDFGGVVKEVCLEYLPDLQVGEYAIVHVGFALQRLDEESARQTSNSSPNSACSGGVRRPVGGGGGGGGVGRRPSGGRGAPRRGAAVKYLDEFQDPELARRLLDDIHATVTRPWALMEVCGGQTHTIIRHGIDQLLPEQVELIHGPGCPVCVTPLEVIDKALEIASRPGVIFCSFGDMLRVPGTGRDLFQVRSEGGDVRVVYSPLDALRIAQQNPDREVVFFGIGFETTAPPNAMTVHQARKLGIRNFSLLVSHVRVPPGDRGDHASPSCRVQALPRGRACVQRDGHGRVPGAGRTPPGADRGDRLRAAGHPRRRPPHRPAAGARRAHRGQRLRRVPSAPEGNPAARAMLEDVFEVTDRAWRGIGVIPDSGWRLSPTLPRPRRRAPLLGRAASTPGSRPSAAAARSCRGCSSRTSARRSAPLCTPRTPLGATMVSSEGACAAYYLYRRLTPPPPTPGRRAPLSDTTDPVPGRPGRRRARTSPAGPARRRCATSRAS